VVKHFTYADGAGPWAGLTAIGNTLYGTTVEGGALANGTIFKLENLIPLRFLSDGSLTVSNGLFVVRLSGPEGARVVVDAASTLGNWTPVLTNILNSNVVPLSLPMGGNATRLYRARFAP
jgi:uncharacterized repeat protein (TIGR03803 family)